MNTAEKLTAIAQNQEKVYDKGRQDEWSDFWDVYQSNGSRRDYVYAFANSAWSEDTFRPKYDFVIRNANSMFISTKLLIDLEQHLKDLGVKWDTSAMINIDTTFNGTSFTVLPEMNLTNLTAKNLSSSFANMPNCTTIRKIISKSDISFSSAFSNTPKLENIIFEGDIGKNINFSHSPLSVDSMKSIITHLVDYSTGSTGVNTLTLKDECKIALEAEGATSPNGNLWTEYVSDLGWVLA